VTGSVRAERLDGPDVGKPKPKPDPKGHGGTKYTSCNPEPFGGQTITLRRIAGDINDSAILADVTITSFPCITTSSQSVDFDFGSREIPNLAEVRFANWVTGPDGSFNVRTLLLAFLPHLLLRALPYVLLQ